MSKVLKLRSPDYPMPSFRILRVKVLEGLLMLQLQDSDGGLAGTP